MTWPPPSPPTMPGRRTSNMPPAPPPILPQESDNEVFSFSVDSDTVTLHNFPSLFTNLLANPQQGGQRRTFSVRLPTDTGAPPRSRFVAPYGNLLDPQHFEPLPHFSVNPRPPSPPSPAGYYSLPLDLFEVPDELLPPSPSPSPPRVRRALAGSASTISASLMQALWADEEEPRSRGGADSSGAIAPAPSPSSTITTQGDQALTTHSTPDEPSPPQRTPSSDAKVSTARVREVKQRTRPLPSVTIPKNAAPFATASRFAGLAVEDAETKGARGKKQKNKHKKGTDDSAASETQKSTKKEERKRKKAEARDTSRCWQIIKIMLVFIGCAIVFTITCTGGLKSYFNNTTILSVDVTGDAVLSIMASVSSIPPEVEMPLWGPEESLEAEIDAELAVNPIPDPTVRLMCPHMVTIVVEERLLYTARFDNDGLQINDVKPPSYYLCVVYMRIDISAHLARIRREDKSAVYCGQCNRDHYDAIHDHFVYLVTRILRSNNMHFMAGIVEEHATADLLRKLDVLLFRP